MKLQMRLIEIEIAGSPAWVIQSFRNSAWDVDPRTWDPNHCGYFRNIDAAYFRFDELVNPKEPKVLKEATVEL